MIIDFDGHVFDVSAIKEQVSFCCDDWTAFIVVYSSDFWTLTWIHVVENKIPQRFSSWDFLLGITEQGGIPDFFPCILNASDGAKCGILFSPGVAKGLAKTHCPSQHDLTKDGHSHRSLFNFDSGENNKKRLTLTIENTLYGYMSCSPFGSDYTLTNLSPLVMRVTKTQSRRKTWKT